MRSNHNPPQQTKGTAEDASGLPPLPSLGTAIKYRTLAGDGDYDAIVVAHRGDGSIDLNVYSPGSKHPLFLSRIEYHRGVARTCARGRCYSVD